MIIGNIYDLLIQNNASKESFVFSGLTDESESHLYHKFDLDISAPEGEYTYAVLKNSRDDVSYELMVPLLDTIVNTAEDSVVLSDLQPSTGLLRIGSDVGTVNIYDNTVESGTTNNNDTIFYYDD